MRTEDFKIFFSQFFTEFFSLAQKFIRIILLQIFRNQKISSIFFFNCPWQKISRSKNFKVPDNLWISKYFSIFFLAKIFQILRLFFYQMCDKTLFRRILLNKYSFYERSFSWFPRQIFWVQIQLIWPPLNQSLNCLFQNDSRK